MLKSEFEETKSKILAEFGIPEYNDMHEPVNESAKRLIELRRDYRISCLHASRAKRKDEQLKEIVDQNVKLDDIKQLKHTRSFESISIDSTELLAFTDKERSIIEDKFDNFNQKNKQLALKHSVTTQFVTSLFKSAAFKILVTKVFDRVLPVESLVALRDKVLAGDSKVILEVARHYKIIQPETLDINSKPKQIDDPEIIKQLRELGDKLA